MTKRPGATRPLPQFERAGVSQCRSALGDSPIRPTWRGWPSGLPPQWSNSSLSRAAQTSVAQAAKPSRSCFGRFLARSLVSDATGRRGAQWFVEARGPVRLIGAWRRDCGEYAAISDPTPCLPTRVSSTTTPISARRRLPSLTTDRDAAASRAGRIPLASANASVPAIKDSAV